MEMRFKDPSLLFYQSAIAYKQKTNTYPSVEKLFFSELERFDVIKIHNELIYCYPVPSGDKNESSLKQCDRMQAEKPFLSEKIIRKGRCDGFGVGCTMLIVTFSEYPDRTISSELTVANDWYMCRENADSDWYCQIESP